MTRWQRRLGAIERVAAAQRRRARVPKVVPAIDWVAYEAAYLAVQGDAAPCGDEYRDWMSADEYARLAARPVGGEESGA